MNYADGLSDGSISSIVIKLLLKVSGAKWSCYIYPLECKFQN